jgi:hypothetical protein
LWILGCGSLRCRHHVDPNFKAVSMPTNKEHQKNESMMARWTRTLGIFTIVLALLSAITAVILYQTDQTTRQSQIATIYIKRVKASIARTVNNGPPQIVFVAEWANGGTTGTRELRYRDNCGGMGLFGKDLHWKQYLDRSKIGWSEGYIGPNATQDMYMCSGLASYLLAQMSNFSEGWFQVGEAWYRDVYGGHHYVSYCYQINIITGDLNDITPYPCRGDAAKYNCADDQCYLR